MSNDLNKKAMAFLFGPLEIRKVCKHGYSALIPTSYIALLEKNILNGLGTEIEFKYVDKNEYF